MIRYERICEGYLSSLGRPAHNNNYFLAHSGRPLTTAQIEVIVREAGEKAKVRPDIRCSPHTLRHYAIQANLRNGLDLCSCLRIAGHDNIQTTNLAKVVRNCLPLRLYCSHKVEFMANLPVSIIGESSEHCSDT
ncbi:tyrosine-type recombinase/integrase [Lysinibacillus sp. NPDC098008]|uniref:tyrosine-type recombinase/integrase n=1 Tax=Lysinibacillus sp. NPDC098008 TaxID=3364146 RepID=UPI0037FD82EF